LRFILLSLFLIAVTGCNERIHPPEGFIKVEGTSERAGSLGFAFMTPKGENWYGGFNSNTLTYLKTTDPTQLSFFFRCK